MTKEIKKVATHNGQFHADEVFSFTILKKLFGNLEIVRTRDGKILETVDLMFDVGLGEFDHHQTEKKVRDNGIPYAACGLIWRGFGKDVISKVSPKLSIEEIDKVFRLIDEGIIQTIDAFDNGVELKHEINIYNVSSIISTFNPTWNSSENEDKKFFEAVDFASVILDNALNQYISVVEAKSIVEKAYKNRTQKEFIVLEKNCPWQMNLETIDLDKEVLYVVFPDSVQGYMVMTVRKEVGSFIARKDLPESWAGKRDEEFNKATGIKDGIFCHKARFIAGTHSLGSAINLTVQAINA